MKKATFFLRTGGIIVTEVDDSDTASSIGQRMAADGFIIGTDSFWGTRREVPINLSDVTHVIIKLDQ